jgi:MFS family permease
MPGSSPLATYQRVLRHALVRGLMWRLVIARLPLGMVSLALLLFVRARTGSFSVAGIVVGAFVLGEAVGGPIQGKLLDRGNPISVLALCTAAHAALLIALLVSTRVSRAEVVLAGEALAAGVALPAFGPSARSLWPTLVAREEVDIVFAVDALTQELTWVAGPLLVVLADRFAGTDAALMLTACIALLGGLLYVSGPCINLSPGHQVREARARRGFRSDGFTYLLVSVLLLGIGLGALQLALPALAVRIEAAGAAGVFLGLWALGSMIGGFCYGARDWTWPGWRRRLGFLGVLCVTLAPFEWVDSVWSVAGASVLAGLAIAPIFSCEMTAVHALARPGEEGVVFALYTSSLIVGVGCGTALAGPLASHAGLRAPATLACVGVALSLLVGVIGCARIDAEAGVRRRGTHVEDAEDPGSTC